MPTVKAVDYGNVTSLLVSKLSKPQANMIAGLTNYSFPGSKYWKVLSIILGNEIEGYTVRFDFVANIKKDPATPTGADLDFIQEHLEEFKEPIHEIARDDDVHSRFANIGDRLDDGRPKRKKTRRKTG